MIIIFKENFKAKLKARFEKYNFEVGILDDSSYKLPKIGKRGSKGADVLTSYAGGPLRKKTSKDSGKNISDVSKSIRDHIGLNYLTEPFKNKSSDIIKFTKSFFDLAFGRSEKRRCENLLQAIVRNPILRDQYMSANSALTQKIKGFNRPLFDTGQFFKAIKASCKVRV